MLLFTRYLLEQKEGDIFMYLYISLHIVKLKRKAYKIGFFPFKISQKTYLPEYLHVYSSSAAYSKRVNDRLYRKYGSSFHGIIKEGLHQSNPFNHSENANAVTDLYREYSIDVFGNISMDGLALRNDTSFNTGKSKRLYLKMPTNARSSPRISEYLMPCHDPS